MGAEISRRSSGTPPVQNQRALISGGLSGAIYVDQLEEQGVALHRRICDLDLEGIVAKHSPSACCAQPTDSDFSR